MGSGATWVLAGRRRRTRRGSQSRVAGRAARSVPRVRARGNQPGTGRASRRTAVVGRRRTRARMRAGRRAEAPRMCRRFRRIAARHDLVASPVEPEPGDAGATGADRERISARPLASNLGRARERGRHAPLLPGVSRNSGPAHRSPELAAIPRGSPCAHADGAHPRALPLFHPVEGLAQWRHPLCAPTPRSGPLGAPALPPVLSPRPLLRCAESAC